jgi:hypothetical protein
MIAILNHRTTAYTALHEARSRLMHLRGARSGLFVEKQTNPFSCKAVLDLLAEIASAKLEELRLLICLDMFERDLRIDKHAKQQKRIWLGEQKIDIPEDPQFHKRNDMNRYAVWLYSHS